MFEIGRFEIFPTGFNRFHGEMIACAVIVSNVHEPLMECREKPTYSNILLPMPFTSGNSCIAV